MKVEFTNRAVRDLRAKSALTAAVSLAIRIAAALELRLREIVAQIAQAPESAPGVEQWPGMRVVPLVPYPFKVFYRMVDGTVMIVHIRHTARRPWRGT